MLYISMSVKMGGDLPDMMAQAYNPSTSEAEAEGSQV
jgi:hypothetical protein